MEENADTKYRQVADKMQGYVYTSDKVISERRVFGERS